MANVKVTVAGQACTIPVVRIGQSNSKFSARVGSTSDKLTTLTSMQVGVIDRLVELADVSGQAANGYTLVFNAETGNFEIRQLDFNLLGNIPGGLGGDIDGGTF